MRKKAGNSHINTATTTNKQTNKLLNTKGFAWLGVDFLLAFKSYAF